MSDRRSASRVEGALRPLHQTPLPGAADTGHRALKSVCAAMAADFGCVSEYAPCRVEDADSAPVADVRKGRTVRGGPLVEGKTLDAARTAATARPAPTTPQPDSAVPADPTPAAPPGMNPMRAPRAPGPPLPE